MGSTNRFVGQIRLSRKPVRLRKRIDASLAERIRRDYQGAVRRRRANNILYEVRGDAYGSCYSCGARLHLPFVCAEDFGEDRSESEGSS